MTNDTNTLPDLDASLREANAIMDRSIARQILEEAAAADNECDRCGDFRDSCDCDYSPE